MWSEEEDYKLISLVKYFSSSKWTKISAKLHNRSDVQCRYRFNILSKRPGFDQFYESVISYSPHDSPQKSPQAPENNYEPVPSIQFIPYPPPQPGYILVPSIYSQPLPVMPGLCYMPQPQGYPVFYRQP
jgi:hypothetical protein